MPSQARAQLNENATYGQQRLAAQSTVIPPLPYLPPSLLTYGSICMLHPRHPISRSVPSPCCISATLHDARLQRSPDEDDQYEDDKDSSEAQIRRADEVDFNMSGILADHKARALSTAPYRIPAQFLQSGAETPAGGIDWDPDTDIPSSRATSVMPTWLPPPPTGSRAPTPAYESAEPTELEGRQARTPLFLPDPESRGPTPFQLRNSRDFTPYVSPRDALATASFAHPRPASSSPPPAAKRIRTASPPRDEARTQRLYKKLATYLDATAADSDEENNPQDGDKEDDDELRDYDIEFIDDTPPQMDHLWRFDDDNNNNDDPEALEAIAARFETCAHDYSVSAARKKRGAVAYVAPDDPALSVVVATLSPLVDVRPAPQNETLRAMQRRLRPALPAQNLPVVRGSWIQLNGDLAFVLRPKKVLMKCLDLPVPQPQSMDEEEDPRVWRKARKEEDTPDRCEVRQTAHTLHQKKYPAVQPTNAVFHQYTRTAVVDEPRGATLLPHIGSSKAIEYRGAAQADDAEAYLAEQAGVAAATTKMVQLEPPATFAQLHSILQARDKAVTSSTSSLKQGGVEYANIYVQVAFRHRDKGFRGQVIASFDTKERSNHLRVQKTSRHRRRYLGGDTKGIMLTIKNEHNNQVSVPIENVIHDLTRLPLVQAQYLPSRVLYAPRLMTPSSPEPRPHTLPPLPQESDPQWGLESSAKEEQQRVAREQEQQRLQQRLAFEYEQQRLPGECDGTWLLTPGLVGKRVDVVIEGIMGFNPTKAIHQVSDKALRSQGENGVVIPKALPNCAKQIEVFRVGQNQHKISFPLSCIKPVRECAGSLIMKRVERVIVLGPDVEGNPSLIGSYAQTQPYIIHPHGDDVVAVRRADGSGPFYFHILRLCLSKNETVGLI
ncbi:hypothetical protein DFH09DRAFT_1309063 [Mycena vulgaris]|nr:hypothetical protein DFH09DRAFT_1309063 [Mycena vulgaris]